MPDRENPLDRLHIDAEAFDREALAEFLEDRIGIDQDTGEPRFLGQFDALGNEEQMTAYLLYRRAGEDLGHFDSVGQSASEISDAIDIGSSSVSRYADELAFIDNAPDKGGYFIISTEITTAIDFARTNDE